MKKLLIMLCVFFTALNYAQVGIGTEYPNAALDIATTPNGIPALELNPQSAPVGTESGQIAVIGNLLFTYDENRGKWLSVATSTFNFGKENGLNNTYLEYSGDITASGPSMPGNGTIVYLTLNSSGGNPSKPLRLEIYNSNAILVSSHTLNPVNGKLILKNSNIDFNEGDYFRVFVTAGAGPSINDASVILWTKWRR